MVDEDNDEAIANAAEETLSNSQYNDATLGDEEKEEHSEESSHEQYEQSKDDEDPH